MSHKHTELCYATLACESSEALSSALADAERLNNFAPTATQINALPEPIRKYIHELHTICDPAGDVASRIHAQDTVKAQLKLIEELESALATKDAALDRLAVQTDWWQAARKAGHE